MTDEEAAREIDRIIAIMQQHDSALENTTPPLICPYQSPSNQQSDADGQTRAVAGSESPKIKQEAPTESESRLSGLAVVDLSSTPTSDIVNHGLPHAQPWANASSDSPTGASQADQARDDLRNKLVRSEVERLTSLLVESEAKHKVKDEQLHHLKSELGSSRRTVEDVRGGKLQQLRSELGSARRSISDQELEIKKLHEALDHQKELVTVYKQVTAAQSRTGNAASWVETPRPSLKRRSSPEPASGVKRTRLSPAYASPLKQVNSSGIRHQGFNILLPLESEFGPAKAPRAFLGEQPLGLVRGSGPSEFTPRGPDLYNPPYSNHFVQKQEIDRYTPIGSVSKGSRDRYIPAYGVPTRTASTADYDLTQSKPVQVPGMVSQSPGIGGSSRPSGGQRPLLPGNAPEAFARAQRLGVPYDPAKQPGIPRKCDVCSMILTSGSKLDQHVRRHHPTRCGGSTPQPKCLFEES